MAAAKRRGLGARDLDALLGPVGGDIDNASENEGELRNLNVGKIQPGKYQPRQHIDADRLEELAASIRVQGLIQPIVVRSIGADRYEIIAGERRWRAAQLAGLTEVAALVREVPDQAVVAMALIENIQREDLSPLEQAQALQRLIAEFKLTHQQVADAVGRSRAAVSNLLRLLDLPPPIRQMLEQGKLEMGHARCLLTLEPANAIELAQRAVAKDWSVRELEEAVRGAQSSAKGKAKKTITRRDPNIEALERELGEKLAARVNLQHSSSGRGKLVIHYHSLDELDGVLVRLR
jgi:ParB family transcriptional regulator, chromosome partitioning protein